MSMLSEEIESKYGLTSYRREYKRETSRSYTWSWPSTNPSFLCATSTIQSIIINGEGIVAVYAYC